MVKEKSKGATKKLLKPPKGSKATFLKPSQVYQLIWNGTKLFTYKVFNHWLNEHIRRQTQKAYSDGFEAGRVNGMISSDDVRE